MCNKKDLISLDKIHIPRWNELPNVDLYLDQVVTFINSSLEAFLPCNSGNDDKKEKNYIRKERYAGSMSRSFYAGDGISQKDIHAKYESGILRLTLPKKAPEAIEKENFIAIE